MLERRLALLLLDAETGRGGGIAAALVFFGSDAGGLVLAEAGSGGGRADGTFGAGRGRRGEGGGRGKVGLKREVGPEFRLGDAD